MHNDITQSNNQNTKPKKNLVNFPFFPLIYKQQKLMPNTSNFVTIRFSEYGQVIHEIEPLRWSKFKSLLFTIYIHSYNDQKSNRTLKMMIK